MARPTSAGPILMTLLAAASAQAATGSPEDFDSRFQAARALALGGKRSEAIAAYSALLERSPGNSDVLLGRGRVHAWMGDWSLAERDLLAATKSSPRYADAWSALGDLYLWSDRWPQAAEAYSHWIELEPLEGDAWIARGKAHRAAGNASAARADFNRAATRGIDVGGLLASVAPEPEPAASLAGSRPAETYIPERYRWSAGLSADRVHFRGSGNNWVDSVASLRRQTDRGSIGFEYLESRRFGITDHAYAVDGYLRLWPRAYVNGRFQLADTGTLFPHNRWRAELFQGVGPGWELSAGYDRLSFGNDVELLSLGVGKYVGNWYFRLRHLHVPGTASDPSSSDSDRATARYYYAGDSDRYLEVTGGMGHAEPATTVTATPSTAGRNSASVGAAWSGLIAPHIGFKLSYSHGYGYESQPTHHDSVSGSLYTRW